jgi:hypothetical protein
MSSNIWRIGAAAAGLLLVASVAFACGGSTDDAGDSEAQRIGEAGGNDTFTYTTDAALGAVPPSDGDAAEQVELLSDKSSGGSAGAGAAQILDRKQILTATVRIEAEDVTDAFQQAGAIAVAAGGVVFSSTFSGEGDTKTASVTIRIPNEGYQSTLASLRELGDVKREESTGTDVTGEYIDMQSRLRNLTATEAQYLELLGKATNINDILTVQDRLNVTRSEIEQVQGRIALFDNQTELSTITLFLTAPLAVADSGGSLGNPLEVAEEAFEASLVTLGGIAIGVLAVIAYSWWLIPLVAAGAYIWRRQVKANRQRQQVAPPAA